MSRTAPSWSRTALAAVFGLMALGVHPAAAAPDRLVLDPERRVPAEGLRGDVDVVVRAPYQPARVTLILDGRTLDTLSRAPYSFRVDFGATVVEHRIDVEITRPDRTDAIRWQTVVNKGKRPFSVRIRPDLASNRLRAIVTAPSDDPLVAVEFWQRGEMLKRTEAPPHELDLPSNLLEPVFVSARTRSGQEKGLFYDPHGSSPPSAFDARVMQLFVTVEDAAGLARTELDRRSFRVIDNGTEGRIVEVAPAGNEPIALTLILDASNSMNFWMPQVSASARRFLSNTLKDGDKVSIYAVRSVPKRELPLTGDLAQAPAILATLQADGDTALYDALRGAIRELDREEGRRAIVVFSDGTDTRSFTAYEDVLELARNAGVSIYSITFGDRKRNAKGEARLNVLSTETGGFLTHAGETDLDIHFRKIERDIRAQYTIRYEVFDETESNEWRTVRVMVRSPRLTARTIRGYFTP